jgi:multicomponent Na+:H+ antiporter subunit F
VNAWWIAATLFTLALIPCLAVGLRGAVGRRLVALEMAGTVESLLLLVLAEAMDRPAFMDLGLTMALMTYGGGLVFARFLEQSL